MHHEAHWKWTHAYPDGSTVDYCEPCTQEFHVMQPWPCRPAQAERMRALEDVLTRLMSWDHFDAAADGTYWRSEITTALRTGKGEEGDDSDDPTTSTDHRTA